MVPSVIQYFETFFSILLQFSLFYHPLFLFLFEIQNLSDTERYKRDFRAAGLPKNAEVLFPASASFICPCIHFIFLLSGLSAPPAKLRWNALPIPNSAKIVGVLIACWKLKKLFTVYASRQNPQAHT
jgi:hypothetical protein